tara:strand:+ start:448 stop:630 length:183 start_codon:yes stop_codon:yes gene_type:complete
MKFTNIKRLLRQQVESGVRVLWTFNEVEPEFTMIYKSYNNNLTIYTPKQLIDYLDGKEKE